MDFGLRNACLAFSADAAGGLATSFAAWLFGKLGITAALGVSFAPDRRALNARDAIEC